MRLIRPGRGSLTHTGRREHRLVDVVVTSTVVMPSASQMRASLFLQLGAG